MAVKGYRADYVIKDEVWTFTTWGSLFAAKPLDLRGYPRSRFRIRKGQLRDL